MPSADRKQYQPLGTANGLMTFRLGDHTPPKNAPATTFQSPLSHARRRLSSVMDSETKEVLRVRLDEVLVVVDGGGDEYPLAARGVRDGREGRGGIDEVPFDPQVPDAERVGRTTDEFWGLRVAGAEKPLAVSTRPCSAFRWAFRQSPRRPSPS